MAWRQTPDCDRSGHRHEDHEDNKGVDRGARGLPRLGVHAAAAPMRQSKRVGREEGPCGRLPELGRRGRSPSRGTAAGHHAPVVQGAVADEPNVQHDGLSVRAQPGTVKTCVSSVAATSCRFRHVTLFGEEWPSRPARSRLGTPKIITVAQEGCRASPNRRSRASSWSCGAWEAPPTSIGDQLRGARSGRSTRALGEEGSQRGQRVRGRVQRIGAPGRQSGTDAHWPAF
jgi:hypothetical protein